MPLKEYFEFYAPTKVMYGYNVVQDTGAEAEALGCGAALILTDEGVMGAGLLEKVRKSIEESSVELVDVYDAVPVNSEVEVCREIAEIGRKAGVDCLISVGGGSVIDTGKGANILLGVGGDLLEDWQGTHLVPEPLKNHIAIPTTAGTGAEVTLGAVIKHTPAGQKVTFNSKYLLPDVAMLDPGLTESMPPGLTAATGIDALTHAVESFSSMEHSPPSDAFSYYCVRSIMENLPIAVEDGSDLEARGNMLVAANLAGMALSTTLSIGACHAMAHAAGGLSPVTHGVANAIILPVVLEFNMEYCTDRYAALASATGVDVSGLDEFEAAGRVIEAITGFIARFGMPRSLKEAGADPALAERMTEEAMGDGQMYGNPREAEFEDILALYERLLS
ncbi:MAG: iron-containing alcohol dehydrogenase [Actinobacteria bacterium]|nr:iron-containing alcohol dehydrogenase [Actinomycetota bacterium]MBU1942656.1 iron-containing alcohol dehydrogenase [Actinomycetota bacterium]MBU2685978.1 iron-containing alcohol dehydrogenase [Actinomycetota bacterium]